MRRFLAILALLLLSIVGYSAWIFHLISRQASKDEARPADVIVVFGAAEYRGKPSPVFRARLDHALGLYRQGLASTIITTGGHGPDPKFTEAEVGRNYLLIAGIPDDHLLAATQGDSTYTSVREASTLMRSRNWQTCVVVSDGFHMFRIKRLFSAAGLTAYASPARSSPLAAASTATQFRHVAREVLAYAMWRVGIRS